MAHPQVGWRRRGGYLPPAAQPIRDDALAVAGISARRRLRDMATLRPTERGRSRGSRASPASRAWPYATGYSGWFMMD